METNIYQSDMAIHAGEFLEEVLEELGMTQDELSKRMGRPAQAINEIIKGVKSITPTTAIELEDVTKVPAHIWIGLETEYQMIKAKQEELQKLEEESSFVCNFPYSELVKLGLVKASRNILEKVEQLKEFFRVARLSQIPHIKAYQPAFRVSNENNVSHEAIAAWLQVGRLQAEKTITPEIDKKKLENNLNKLRELTMLDIKKAIEHIHIILNDCGVVFCMVPHFKSTYINGATFWLENGKKAVIMMSLKGRYSDIFWFSFFHEVGHILLHKKRELFLEDGKTTKYEKQEHEANEFAKDLLIPEKDYQKFIEQDVFTGKSVQEFAKSINIKPSIVVGRLMHEQVISYSSQLNKLRDKYLWA